MGATQALQCVLEGGQEGRVLEGSADILDQVAVLLKAHILSGEPIQAEGSSRSHHPAEVKGGSVLQELPSKQVLLEAARGRVSQSLLSPAHRGEETVEDFHQVRQEGGQIRLYWKQVPERLEEGDTGGQSTARGGLERRINRTGEELGQSHATLRQTVNKT